MSQMVSCLVTWSPAHWKFLFGKADTAFPRMQQEVVLVGPSGDRALVAGPQWQCCRWQSVRARH